MGGLMGEDNGGWVDEWAVGESGEWVKGGCIVS